MKAIFFDIDGTLINKKGIVFDNTLEELNELRKKGVLLFGITVNNRKIIEKLKELKLYPLFEEIVHVKRLKNKDISKPKEEAFEYLLKKYKLKKENVLVVGDNPKGEILAAKRLKIPFTLIKGTFNQYLLRVKGKGSYPEGKPYSEPRLRNWKKSKAYKRFKIK